MLNWMNTVGIGQKGGKGRKGSLKNDIRVLRSPNESLMKPKRADQLDRVLTKLISDRPWMKEFLYLKL